jgi:hypothetical protein
VPAALDDAQAPQSKSCATCKHNQWGSKITENGKKVKACSDSVRLAVAPAGSLNDPMLLRVPPATIRPLGEYGQMLSKKNIGYQMVVTKIAFDKEAESPKLTFRPVGFLDEAAFAEVQEVADGDTVRNILGAVVPVSEEAVSGVDEPASEVADVVKAAISKAKTVTDTEVEAAVDAAAKPAKAPAKPAKPAAKPEVADDDDDLSLDGISFDD